LVEGRLKTVSSEDRPFGWSSSGKVGRSLRLDSFRFACLMGWRPSSPPSLNLLMVAHQILLTGQPYRELGSTYLEERNQQARIQYHLRCLRTLAARGRSQKAPLTCVRGSVDSVRYRAATARERVLPRAARQVSSRNRRNRRKAGGGASAGLLYSVFQKGICRSELSKGKK